MIAVIIATASSLDGNQLLIVILVCIYFPIEYLGTYIALTTDMNVKQKVIAAVRLVFAPLTSLLKFVSKCSLWLSTRLLYCRKFCHVQQMIQAALIQFVIDITMQRNTIRVSLITIVEATVKESTHVRAFSLTLFRSGKPGGGGCKICQGLEMMQAGLLTVKDCWRYHCAKEYDGCDSHLDCCRNYSRSIGTNNIMLGLTITYIIKFDN